MHGCKKEVGDGGADGGAALQPVAAVRTVAELQSVSAKNSKGGEERQQRKEQTSVPRAVATMDAIEEIDV